MSDAFRPFVGHFHIMPDISLLIIMIINVWCKNSNISKTIPCNFPRPIFHQAFFSHVFISENKRKVSDNLSDVFTPNVGH